MERSRLLDWSEMGSTHPTIGDVHLLGLQPSHQRRWLRGENMAWLRCIPRGFSGSNPVSPGFQMLSDVSGNDSVLFLAAEKNGSDVNLVERRAAGSGR